jgi:hypothetical protein
MDWSIGFIDHFNTRLGTTFYRSLTHTDQCPQSITVSTRRFLTTDFNTGIITVSLSYTLQISHINFSSQPSVQNFTELSLFTNWIVVIIFLITTLHEPNRKHRFQQYTIFVGVFTDPSPRNGLHNPVVLLRACCGRYRATADLYRVTA